MLIGVAFAAGAKQGLFLTLALSLELLALGLAIASSLAARGASRARMVLIPSALALLLLVGGVIGDTVLRGASEHTLAGVLSFGCAALLYLVTEELLVEAHEAAAIALLQVASRTSRLYRVINRRPLQVHPPEEYAVHDAGDGA